MGNYFYGRITKSGKKLLINVPIKKTEFEYDRLVKVFLLPEDIVEEEIELEKEYMQLEQDAMDLNDAADIIRDLDTSYDFSGKRGFDIMEHAKKLRGEK